ncbi:hypothetical protein ACFH04_30760 [Streptomyces noboritoensis]|uniref:Uncharacterized protein n=1 Tax=Streptomyces noboritoensis TaxID=67337 RepID=A0ABV6TUB7_9ACTN
MNKARHIAEQLPDSDKGSPIGLDVCWTPAPGNPARNCTLRDGHDERHFHEYSGVTWDRPGQPQ